MNKRKIIGNSLLGLVGAITTHAQDDSELANNKALENLGNSRIQAIEVDPLVGNTCYGLPCPGESINNCDDAVIENNLQKLRRLNIVGTGALSPFACTGYCFSNTPEGRQADKCEKAEALAKLVQLAEPLKVSVKH